MRCSRIETAPRHRASCLAIALIASGVAYGAASAQSGLGSIRGIVTDTMGTPLSGVTVGVQGSASKRKWTNAGGEFALDSVPAGRRVLRLSRIGAYPQTDTVVVETGRASERRYEMRMMPLAPAETLPPRYARGMRPDTAPAESEEIDRVARMVGLPLLRAQRASSGGRELRLWTGGGIAIPYRLVRIAIDDNRVQGQVVRWMEDVISTGVPDPARQAHIDSVPAWLQSTFGCGAVVTDTLRYRRQHLFAVCTSRYRREPDWRGLLRELETHQVWTLPDASELPLLANIVSLDGDGLTVEAWDGRRYHTYTFGNTDLIPAPEAREAAAIQRALLAFFKRTHSDLR